MTTIVALCMAETGAEMTMVESGMDVRRVLGSILRAATQESERDYSTNTADKGDSQRDMVYYKLFTRYR